MAYSSGFSLHFIVLAVAASLPPKYRSDLFVAFETKFRRGPQYFNELIVCKTSIIILYVFTNNQLNPQFGYIDTGL